MTILPFWLLRQERSTRTRLQDCVRSFKEDSQRKSGRGAKFFTFAKHNTLFQHSNSMLIATRGEEVSIDRIRELKVSKYNETSRKGLLHKMFLQRKFPFCQQTDLKNRKQTTESKEEVD